MTRFMTNRDGGETDEKGHLKFMHSSTVGEVFSGGVVSQNSTPNMSVNVSIIDALIRDAANKYAYHIWSDAVENVTIATADAANPRRDFVIAYVDRAVTPAGVNNPSVWQLVSVAGTPAGSPADPTVSQIQASAVGSNPYIILARVSVAAATTSITDGSITDRRTLIYFKNSANVGLLGDSFPYTAGGSYSKPSNLKFVIVEVQGGGGAGGMATTDSTVARGGAGGGFVRKKILAAALSASETVTVGAAGASSSGNGGNSSFGAHCTANGGAGGGTNTGAPATGATGTGGDLTIDGGNGSRGGASSTAGDGSGGGSFMGSGGKQGIYGTSGVSGNGYGAGGGGGHRSGSTSQGGGAGSQGIVIVHEYF